MSFEGHRDQNEANDGAGSEQVVMTDGELSNAMTFDQEAPQQAQETFNAVRQSLQSMQSRLFEGGINQNLQTQLQDELLKFRVALRDIVQKVEASAEALSQSQTAQNAKETARDLITSAEKRKAIYSQLIYIVLAEVDNTKLAQAWTTINSMLDKKEVMEVFVRLSENKDDFIKLIEQAKLHEDSIRGLQQCVQEGDWTRLQQIIADLIEQYDS